MGSLADEFERELEEFVEGGDLEELDDAVLNEEPIEEEIVDAVEEYKRARLEGSGTTGKLLKDSDFLDFIQTLKTRLQDDRLGDEDVPNDQDVQRCGQLMLDIDKEILDIHRYVKSLYNRRFPELENIVLAPLDYLHCVKVLKNEIGQTAECSDQLQTVIPNQMVLALAVSASVTTGQPLTRQEIKKALDACAEVDELVDIRGILLTYTERYLENLAPNLTALCGPSLAAQLIIHAGSLKALAEMPSQNVLVLGGSSFAKASSAFAIGQNGPGTLKKQGQGYGLLFQADLVQAVPPVWRKRALRLLAGKAALAARADYFGIEEGQRANGSGPAIGRALGVKNGKQGRQWREKILLTLQKVREPPPPTLKRPLPIPDEKPKSRRGGKRQRRLKERYGLSELQRQANRTKFGIDGDYGLDDDDERPTGMIGITDAARLRLTAKQAQKIIPKTDRFKKGHIMDLV